MKSRRILLKEPSITEKVKKQLRQTRNFYVACQVLATLGLPVLEGLTIEFLTGAPEASRTPWFIILSVLVICHLFVAYVLISAETTLPQFLLEFEKQEEDLEEKSALIGQLSAQVELCLASLEAISINFGILEVMQSSQQNPEDSIGLIIAPWWQERDSIWNYDERALWNIVVYWVENGNPDADRMTCLWRQTHATIPKSNRTWQKNDGHIGRCWMRGALQVSPSGYVAMPHRQVVEPMEGDDKYYQSIIAAPIKIDDQVWGVVAVTSSRDGQFNQEEHGQSTQILGMLIAQALKC